MIKARGWGGVGIRSRDNDENGIYIVPCAYVME